MMKQLKVSLLLDRFLMAFKRLRNFHFYMWLSFSMKNLSHALIFTLIRTKFNLHINLLYFLNDCTPNMSGNGAGYNSNSITDPCSESSNSFPTSHHNHEANYNKTSDSLSFISELTNCHEHSLALSILSLTKNVESATSLVQQILLLMTPFLHAIYHLTIITHKLTYIMTILGKIHLMQWNCWYKGKISTFTSNCIHVWFAFKNHYCGHTIFGSIDLM